MKSCVDTAAFHTDFAKFFAKSYDMFLGTIRATPFSRSVTKSLTARFSKTTPSTLPSRASSDLYDILLKSEKKMTPNAFTSHVPRVRQTIELAEINLTPTHLQLRAAQP